MVCLLVFGSDSFIVPAMVLILVILGFRYKRSLREEAQKVGQ